MTAPDQRPLVLPRLLSSALEGAWRAGAATRPELEPEAIVAAAIGRSGPRPAGGLWLGRLELLCAELRSQARLSPLGLAMAQGLLTRLLRQRIRADRLWASTPEIADRPIVAPVVIVGQMRSGTTRLHRLLACDPRFAHTRLFETLLPVPPAGVDLRRAAAWFDHRLLLALNPALGAIHPTSPMAAEEEFGLHAFSFHGAQFAVQWHVPRFARLSGQSPPADVYDEFAMLLKTLGWARGDDPALTWLLKAPQFMTDLPALFARFPDARLILLDREPEAVVASSASLAWNHRRIHCDEDMRAATGRESLELTAWRKAALDAFLAGNPGVPRIAVGYEEVGRDWRAVIGRIYAFLGLAPDRAVEQWMERFLAKSKAHRGHRYALADFGLAPADVARAMDQRKL